MDDQNIVALYWARDQRAIQETSDKYGTYCRSIAQNILRNTADSEECLNDTWLSAWNSLPLQRPAILSSYLGTITRNLSLTRYRAENTQKRSGHRLAFSYEELQESIPDSCSAEESVNARELGRTLDQFLRTIPEQDCCIFLRRYWYLDSISQISSRYDLTEGAVKTRLHRIRKKLKQYLEQEGYTV